LRDYFRFFKKQGKGNLCSTLTSCACAFVLIFTCAFACAFVLTTKVRIITTKLRIITKKVLILRVIQIRIQTLADAQRASEKERQERLEANVISLIKKI